MRSLCFRDPNGLIIINNDIGKYRILNLSVLITLEYSMILSCNSVSSAYFTFVVIQFVQLTNK